MKSKHIRRGLEKQALIVRLRKIKGQIEGIERMVEAEADCSDVLMQVVSARQALDAPLVSAALRMALAQRRPARPLILHSDRGSQFSSAAYRHLLAQHGLIASMSRPGNCYDNAFIESFWSSLKYELVYPQRFATRAVARTAIFDYIETFYNRTRLHSSLHYLSPLNFESKPELIDPFHTVRTNNATPL